MSLIIRSDFPSILENFFGKDSENFSDSSKRGSVPAVNIKDYDHEFQIEVAAPGLKKEDFKLSIDHHVLISSGKESRNGEKDEKGNYTRQEFIYLSFSRSFSLPDIVNADQIRANYNDGILRISVPKK